MFVSLAGVTQPEQVLTGIARAVGVDLAGTGSSLEALVEQVGDDAWLLLLDNLEQVLEAARNLEFERAAQLRDQLRVLKQRLFLEAI